MITSSAWHLRNGDESVPRFNPCCQNASSPRVKHLNQKMPGFDYVAYSKLLEASAAQSMSCPEDWLSFNRDAFRKDVLASFARFSEDFGPFLDQTGGGYEAFPVDQPTIIKALDSRAHLRKSGELLEALLARDVNKMLHAEKVSKIDSSFDMQSMAETLSRLDDDQGLRNRVLAPYFPSVADIPKGPAPPDEFSGLQTVLFKKVFPFVRRLLAAYLDPKRQSNFLLRGTPPGFTWVRNFWDGPISSKAPDNQEKPTPCRGSYEFIFGVPLQVALQLFFWFLDSKQVRHRLADDVEFLDMLCRYAIENNQVQTLLWSPEWPAKHVPHLEEEAAHAIKMPMMIINLVLCERAQPFRQHTRERKIKTGKGVDKDASPAHSLLINAGFFAEHLAQRENTLHLNALREEIGTFHALAFEESDSPARSFDPSDETFKRVNKSFKELKRDQKGWIEGVRSRGSALIESCDACGRNASADVKLVRCAGCKVARYCSTECQREAWKDHKPECRAASK